MRIETATMEDILVMGVHEAVNTALRTLGSLISLLHRNCRSETAERLQVAQRELNNVIAVMSGVYGGKKR